MQIAGRTIAYLAFAAFCVFSSVRDVISEALFKNQTYDANPVFLVFVYSVTTQCVAGAILLFESPARSVKQMAGRETPFLLLNCFTLAAFFFYFLAIDSPLGAAVNSFVDYGSSPAFTAIVGVLVAKEPLDRTFAISASLSLIGIAVLSAPRLYIDQLSLLWIAGLFLSLLSSISSAFYRVYFRVLLVGGATKSVIIFVRLFGTTVALGIILLVKPEYFRADLLVQTAVLGLVGFTIPLFLTLTIIQHVTIPSFAMLLFCVPVFTFILSAAAGYTHLFASDLVAAALTITGATLYERRNRERPVGTS